MFPWRCFVSVSSITGKTEGPGCEEGPGIGNITCNGGGTGDGMCSRSPHTSQFFCNVVAKNLMRILALLIRASFWKFDVNSPFFFLYDCIGETLALKFAGDDGKTSEKIDIEALSVTSDEISSITFCKLIKNCLFCSGIEQRGRMDKTRRLIQQQIELSELFWRFRW